MGLWDRDYSRTGRSPKRAGIDWRSYLPPRAAAALLVLHMVAFFMVLMLRHDGGLPTTAIFVLEGASSHPAAIVLHGLGSGSVLSFAFVVYAIWTLGGRIEARFGAGRLLALYVLGTAVAGGAYYGFAQVAPDLARYPLAMPAGALAAWALGAWRNLAEEVVLVLGRPITVAKATAIGTAIVAGLVFFVGKEGATGWLIAAAAGSLAWPAVNATRGAMRRAPGPVGLERARSAGPETPPDEAQPVADDPAIDDILAKIKREGLDALTPAEHERLEAARQARLRQSR